MKTLYPPTLLFIFSILAGIHFSWALGSTWGILAALPTTEAGELLIQPTFIDSAVVGAGLLTFGIYYLFQTSWVKQSLPQKINSILGWGIPSIFLLRAIGDFKYVGIFKPPMETTFATADFYFYSPLCLLIALLGFLIIKSDD